MEKHVSVNVIGNNRKMLQAMGSTLGTSVFQVEARSCDAEFEKNKLNSMQNGGIDLVINREIKRFRLVSHNVEGVNVEIDAQDAPYVGIHLDNEKKISLPFATDFSRIGEVSDSALREALKGDQNKFFCNARKIADAANALNRNEVVRLNTLIENLQNQVKSLNSCIADNERKANEYEQQMLNSTPNPDYTNGPVEVTIQAEVKDN